MIKLLPTKNDDKNFVTLIEQVLLYEVSFTQSEDIFITKIDHWFDFKWRGFSHKIFGEMGVWRDPLRIPPFIPDRIIEEIYFQKTGESYVQKDLYQLHIYQNSAENAERKINSKSAVYIWFSGDTSNNSQGSLMIYKFAQDSQTSWYVSFIKKTDWQIYKTDNISKAEVKAMIEKDYSVLI
jgi:hypothetical protein